MVIFTSSNDLGNFY